MAQIEARIIIPVADNDGHPFDNSAFAELWLRFGEVSAGATRRGPYLGVWTDAEIRYEEPVFEFEVDLESWFDLPHFLEVVRWVQVRFRQLAIQFKVAGVPETYQPDGQGVQTNPR